MTPETSHTAGIAYLRRAGTSLPLVLLHGIGSHGDSWRSVMRALDPSIDVIAWYAPGYGASDPLTESMPTPASYADRLAQFLDALGLDRVVLAGHSLGTLFAARFAVAHPARVAALALLSPALGYGVAPGSPLPPAIRARIDDLERLGPDSFAAGRAARLVSRFVENPAVMAGVQRAMASVRLPGYAQAVWALGAGTLLADAARIAAPTLVAVGTDDVVTPPANARAVHAALPTPLALELIPRAGHALPQEAPSGVANLLGTLMPENAHV
jgi:pimeloyl-ACP methyl ester carboxylesterase